MAQKAVSLFSFCELIFQELEAELKQDKTHLETLHEKKLNSVKAELDQERQDSQRKTNKLEQTIR